MSNGLMFDLGEGGRLRGDTSLRVIVDTFALPR